jgi:heptosyltransferase-2
LPRDIERPAGAGKPPLILLNPGAQYGSAKCWPAEYFVTLADRLVEELGATILISGAPRERRIIEAIGRSMRHAPVDLLSKGSTLGTLKEIVRRCDLMITNDTGPRHIAAAFDVPVVTLFGPTHPEWTEINFAKERKLAVKVFCGPCQKKTCPLDHRCMIRLTPPMVYDAALQLLPQRDPGANVSPAVVQA